MIELSSGVAAAARFPAVRPRRGAGSLGQRPAPAPPTRSHGARGAPDPLPLAGGLRGMPGRRLRRDGRPAAGRVAVGRERPARPLRLQVPQPADHAHLRLLPALPGTNRCPPGSSPALRAAAGAHGARASQPHRPNFSPSSAGRSGFPSARILQSGCANPLFQPPSCSRKGKEACGVFT